MLCVGIILVSLNPEASRIAPNSASVRSRPPMFTFDKTTSVESRKSNPSTHFLNDPNNTFPTAIT